MISGVAFVLFVLFVLRDVLWIIKKNTDTFGSIARSNTEIVNILAETNNLVEDIKWRIAELESRWRPPPPQPDDPRTDRFEVGDHVEFLDREDIVFRDPEIGELALHRGDAEWRTKKYGPPPLVVEAIEDVPAEKLEHGWYEHIQIVTVNGHRFSAGEFKPLREQSPTTTSERKLVDNIVAHTFDSVRAKMRSAGHVN